MQSFPQMTKILLLSCQGTFGTLAKPGTVHPELRDICLRFLYNCAKKYIDIIKIQENFKLSNFIVGYDGDGSYGKPPPSYYLLMIVLCLLKEGVSCDRIRLAQSQNVNYTESFEKLSELVKDIQDENEGDIQQLKNILTASNNIFIINKSKGEWDPDIMPLTDTVCFSWVKPTEDTKYAYGGIDEKGNPYASTGGWVNWLKINPGETFYLPAWHDSLVNIDKVPLPTYQDSITNSIAQGCHYFGWIDLGNEETIVLNTPQYGRETLNVEEISRAFNPALGDQKLEMGNLSGGMRKRTINKKKIKRKSIKKIKQKKYYTFNI